MTTGEDSVVRVKILITVNQLTKNSSLNDLLESAWLISQYSRSFSTGIGLTVTNLPGPTTSEKS